MLLAQSRTQTVVIGPVLDADGVAVTTAAITNFSLAKNGIAAAFTTETLTHLGNSYYSIALTATNTNSLGILAVFTNNTAWSMTVFRWNVIASSVYDAIVNNATNATGGLLTATGSVSAIAGALLNTGNLPTNFASLAITGGGAVTAGTVSDKTGYSLTQAFPSNFASMSLDVSGRVLLQPTQTGVTIPTVTSVTNAVTAGTVSDKTGYSLVAGTGLGNQTTNITGSISGSVGSVTGNVGGSVVGSVGSVSGITFPANFDKTSIDANGHVTSKVDSINNNAITASSIQANAITAAKIATGAFTAQAFAVDSITASALANDAVTEIQSGLATSSGVTSAFTEIKGATWSSTDTLEAIRDASGSASVNIMPLSSTATQRVSGTTITTFIGDRSPITIAVFDSTGTAVNLTLQAPLEIVIERRDGTDLQVIANASITISGASSNQATFTPDATAVGSLGQHLWALRRTANEQVLAHGNFVVAVAAFDS